MQPPRMLGQMTKKRSVSIGLPGPTSVSHQPGFLVTGCSLGDVLVAGQRMADEDGVRLGGVERAVGLVGDRDRRQQLVAVKPQRLALGQVQYLARGIVRLGKAQVRPRVSFDVRHGRMHWHR